MMHVVTVDGKSGTVKAATPVDLIVAVKKRHAHYVMLRTLRYVGSTSDLQRR